MVMWQPTRYKKVTSLATINFHFWALPLSAAGEENIFPPLVPAFTGQGLAGLVVDYSHSLGVDAEVECDCLPPSVEMHYHVD